MTISTDMWRSRLYLSRYYIERSRSLPTKFLSLNGVTPLVLSFAQDQANRD